MAQDATAEPIAGPSNSHNDPSPTGQLCAMCAKNAAKYTCPRCSIKTCSLPCSQAHKAQGEGCSGIRNKAAYVPMNKYGYMTLMDDYVFLEDIGRKVNDWGREIVQGGYTNTGDGNRGGRGRELRGRGMRGGRGGHRNLIRNKRDTLKMQLDFRDIEIELLPVGMERRTLNQSTWDFKNQTALLTIEFILHPPPNMFEESILTCVRARLAERGKSKKEKPLPPWATELVVPNEDDPDAFVSPVCVMRTKVDPLAALQNGKRALRPGHITRQGYYKLDPNQPLEKVLKHKDFVEFPTIEIWEDGAFTGTIVDDRGAVMHDSEDERKPKRRKLGVREGKKAIKGLLGGYGSDDEEEEEAPGGNSLGLLAGYAGSDDEGKNESGTEESKEPPPISPVDEDEDEWGEEDAEGETDEEYVEENAEHIAAMLEQLRRAGALRDPSGDGRIAFQGDDDDKVDWGEEEEE
ncbi:hypothetical protein K474DRAFT_1671594 [Panus rudis PR-1116 ss-1]|nr:hypothetical protein K474DRAFT_1671594 [Panus rudis PR-1116 ss-1]